jgi:4-aminobutyrate aminotransferase-like enzyme
MDVIEDERLMDRAIDVGDYFLEALKKLAEKHEIIGDIRGRGMFIGIDLVKNRETREPHIKAAEHALTRFREERILMQSDGPFNNVLKIKPPLAFSRENVDTFITTLDSIIEDIEDMQAF